MSRLAAARAGPAARVRGARAAGRWGWHRGGRWQSGTARSPTRRLTGEQSGLSHSPRVPRIPLRTKRRAYRAKRTPSALRRSAPVCTAPQPADALRQPAVHAGDKVLLGARAPPHARSWRATMGCARGQGKRCVRVFAAPATPPGAGRLWCRRVARPEHDVDCEDHCDSDGNHDSDHRGVGVSTNR